MRLFVICNMLHGGLSMLWKVEIFCKHLKKKEKKRKEVLLANLKFPYL